MSTDLLGLVKEQLTTEVVGKISNFLGESSENTQTAFSATTPIILGNLLEKASTLEESDTLVEMFNEGNHDGSLLNSLADLLGSPEGISGILSGGSALVDNLLGPKASGVVDLITNLAGTKKSSSSSVLSLSASVLMAVVGKQISSQGLGASGLSNLLIGQKEVLKTVIPDGAEKFLDLAELNEEEADQKTISNESDLEGSGLTNGFNFFPWLIGAGILFGSWFFIKSCNKTESVAITDSLEVNTELGSNPLKKITQMIKDSIALHVAQEDSARNKKLSSGFAFKVAQTGFEQSLINFIEDKSKIVDKNTWFDFDSLKFDTGKATLKAESQNQIKNIAEILKAFPQVKLKIGGYTDNVGSKKSNLQLSANRAAAVVKAIVALGIEPSRLESEGYGPQYPSASNATEEGRAKNRRIAARVTAK
ncbi:MAG: OmpA family protein [Bacteroidota bacterium]